MRKHFPVLLAVFLASLPMPSSGADALETGRQYAAWFQEARLDELFGRFSPRMADALPADKLAEFQAQVAQQLGAETSLQDERIAETQGLKVYLRLSEFANAPGRVFETQFALQDDGTIEGFFIRPSQNTPGKYDDYITKTDLRLPFEDEWFVFWGGRTVEQNYHRPYPDQRFAYDLLIVRDGQTHAGDGKQNEDYYCFGTPVLAPGDGVIVTAVNDVGDREPGVMIRENPFGNHVVIDHGNGEFSHMAHFRQGSVAVTEGQSVQQGDFLGECGNSGHSSEAHLHYHLQDSPTGFEGDGMPTQFRNYFADGETVERGEPLKGQRVRN